MSELCVCAFLNYLVQFSKFTHGFFFYNNKNVEDKSE